MTIRLWVNQWFSTMYQIIEEMKRGAEKDGIRLYVIGSSTNKEAVYKAVCDAFYEEPLSEQISDYAAWCLEFARQHQVEAFIPKRRFLEIAACKRAFEQAGIRVLVEDDVEQLRLFNDKMETAAYFKRYLGKICEVAEYEVVTDAADFERAYKKLKGVYTDTPLCIKYARGEGGASFKIIEEVPLSIKRLESGSVRMPYDYILQILRSQDHFEPLIVMPYLNGTEISIDCVPLNEGFIAVPRLKGNGRVRIIDDAPLWQDKMQLFMAQTRLRCPFNLQLRYHKDQLYLLEVNTRFSGGVHYAYYDGINLPYIALKQLMGLPQSPAPLIRRQTFSFVEQPVILEE